MRLTSAFSSHQFQSRPTISVLRLGLVLQEQAGELVLLPGLPGVHGEVGEAPAEPGVEAIGVEQARGRRAEHGRVELTGADDGRVLVALVDVHDHVLAEHLPGKVAVGVHQHDEAEGHRQQAGEAAERDLQELPPADHIAPQNWK